MRTAIARHDSDDRSWKVQKGDVGTCLRRLEDNSYDAAFTDPPYGLGFMAKRWDAEVPPVDVWQEMLRVCKPGAFLLAFGGTRTYHRLASNIEDAGWQIRDGLMWLYRSKDQDHKVEFIGGIIAISNVPLRSDPLARALGSRLTVLEHEPSDEEIGAFMRLLASRGYEDMTAAECLEVAEFLIEETRRYDYRLDLRHLTKGWQDYRQFQHRHAVTHWKDLIRTSLTKLATEPIIPLSKREEIQSQRKFVHELMERYPNETQRQLAEWPHSKSLFYERRKEVLAEPQAA